MSIIVDALERVQLDRQTNQSDLHGDRFSHLDESSGTQRDKLTKNSTYKKLIVIILLSVLGINIAYVIKNPNQNNMNFPEELYTSETPRVKTIKEASLTDSLESLDQENEKNLTENKDENALDADFLAEFEDNEVDFFEAESPPVIQPISQPTPKKISKNIINEIIKPGSPDWIKAGITALQENNLTQAVLLWNKGFSTLDDQTKIISIMINRVPGLAKQTLNKLHEHQIDAFAILGLFKDKPAYFTLALHQEDKTIMSDIEQLINSKPYISAQNSIQKRIDQLASQNTPTEKTGIIKNTKIQKVSPLKRKTSQPKKMSNKKRLLIAQEAVINGEYKKAIQKLRPVLFNDKANWEVLFWIGSAKLGLGLYNEADDYFKNALILNADIPQLWIQRAVIAQEKNNHLAALKFLHTARTLAPNTPEVILNIAYSNDALGDRNGAVYAYREFLSLTKNNSQFSQQRQAVNFRLEELGF